MKVYVAGPMTGYPEWNFPAFADAAGSLREAGFEVTSPHEFDLEGGFDPEGDGAGFDLRAALERDVEAVLDADGVALLDGWEESPGAVIEVLTAGSKGAPSRPLKEWLTGVVAALALVLGLGAATPALAGGPESSTLSALRAEGATEGAWANAEADRLEKRLEALPDSPATEEKRQTLRRLIRILRAA